MIKPIPCNTCGGKGCANCNQIGFHGRDEYNDYYLARDASGNVVVAGIKGGGAGGSLGIGKAASSLFSLIGKLLSEPHDFFWAVKNKK